MYQVFEKQIAALSVEEKENFPICQHTPTQEIICGIYSCVNELKSYRNSIEYLIYRYDQGRQFVFYSWNLFSTLLFVQECLKCFGREGDQFVLLYREKVEQEKKLVETKGEGEEPPEKPVQPDPGYRNPYSAQLLESKISSSEVCLERGNPTYLFNPPSHYNIFTDSDTAASRVFFRIVAKVVRMRVFGPDVYPPRTMRPNTNLSASLLFTAFDLCRLSHHTSAPVSSNR